MKQKIYKKIKIKIKSGFMITRICAMGPGWPIVLRTTLKKCDTTRMHDTCIPIELRGLTRSSLQNMS